MGKNRDKRTTQNESNKHAELSENIILADIDNAALSVIGHLQMYLSQLFKYMWLKKRKGNKDERKRAHNCSLERATQFCKREIGDNYSKLEKKKKVQKKW